MNQWLEKKGLPTRYHFNFLTPMDFNKFSHKLRDNGLKDFRSDLDVALEGTA